MKTLMLPLPVQGTVPTRIDMHINMEPGQYGSDRWDVTYAEYLGDDASAEVIARTKQLVSMFAGQANVILVEPPPGYHFCLQATADSSAIAVAMILELVIQLNPSQWETLRDMLGNLIRWNQDALSLPVSGSSRFSVEQAAGVRP